jgi:gamma-glutamylcyclotransferase (GGCT)/AIG2-like uncharacterized protein YtfP
MATQYIFVYGSLRKRFSSPARVVLDHHAEYVGEAAFRGKLYEIDWYPGVIPSKDQNDLVHGEVYKMTNPEEVLSKLDQYEGCLPMDPKPHAFVRKQAQVSLEGGEVTAWIYLYDLSVEDLVQIPSGDYLKFKK